MSPAPMTPLPTLAERADFIYRRVRSGAWAREDVERALRLAEEAARGAGEPCLHEVAFCSRVSDIVRLCGGDPVKAPPAAVAVIEALLKEFYPRTPDPRPAGCVCPVELVRHVVRACPVHGGDHE